MVYISGKLFIISITYELEWNNFSVRHQTDTKLVLVDFLRPEPSENQPGSEERMCMQVIRHSVV